MKWMPIVSALAGLVAFFGVGVGVGRITGERTTTSRLAPDETLRASLVEREWQGLDRNFQVRLESLVDGTSRTIYHSPDEGRPAGTERLIWSKDGTKLLLVGRHFFVKEDLFLDNGDQLYFLYDLPSGKAWLNSAETTDLPALKAETIRGIEFTEPVRLKVVEPTRRDEGSGRRAIGVGPVDQDL